MEVVRAFEIFKHFEIFFLYFFFFKLKFSNFSFYLSELRWYGFNSDFRALSNIFQRPHPTTKICNTMSQNWWPPPTFWKLCNYIEWSQMSKLYCTEGYYQGSDHCIYKQHVIWKYSYSKKFLFEEDLIQRGSYSKKFLFRLWRSDVLKWLFDNFWEIFCIVLWVEKGFFLFFFPFSQFHIRVAAKKSALKIFEKN